MSGHSHASTVKRRKDSVDAKKGSAFSKASRLITIAVKEGGGVGDPEKNSRLKLALEKAKEINMPKENVKRAIDKGTGQGEEADLESVSYEGFGPGGAAIIIECITDNKNRTTSEIKGIFVAGGGNLAEPGAAGHYFERKIVIQVAKEGNGEDQMLKLIDFGVEDIDDKNSYLEIFIIPDLLSELKVRLKEGGFEVLKQDFIMKSKNKLQLSVPQEAKLRNFVEKLENHDDVQKVYTNV